MNVKVKILRDGAHLPAYQSQSAAAADLYACIDAPQTVNPGQRVKIPTGVAIESSDAQTAAIICARSGLSAKHGITLANGIGVVDSDYRGELLVSLVNISDTAYQIAPGERVAQLMFIPVIHAEFLKAEGLSATERGEGGFGSTGT